MERKYLLFLITSFLGCSSPKPQYGIEFNKTRQELGLEALQSDWIASSSEKSYTIYSPSNFNEAMKSHKPLYAQKTVGYDKAGEIHHETNLYYSGKKFKTIDGESSESITIEYYFEPTVKGFDTASKWFCQYDGPVEKWKEPDVYLSKIRILPVDSADAILKTWGFHPPTRVK